MAGKGDKLRKGANLKAYWDNYSNIFGKKTVEQLQEPAKDVDQTNQTNTPDDEQPGNQRQ
jgi:hypothetical protein